MAVTLTMPELRRWTRFGHRLEPEPGSGGRLVFRRPDGVVLLPKQQLAAGDCDEDSPSAEAGNYFVDPEHPSATDDTSNDGTSALLPWKSLTRVRALLADGSYKGGVHIWLRSGRTFSLSSEGVDPDSSGPLLEVTSYGSVAHPITISSYHLISTWGAFVEVDDANGRAAWGGTGAVLDGEDPFFEYDDDRETMVGLKLEDTCYVEVRGLHITGFDHGILIRESEQISLSGLRVSDNLSRGVAILPDADTSTVPSRNVTISTCYVFGNGFGTGGSNIALGARVADCHIDDCDIFGTNGIRGVDGIVMDGASSGHLVERCRIYGHVASLEEGEQWTDASGDLQNYEETDDGEAIDLKGVRQRDAADGDVTVIGDNDLYDNYSDGILIHNGCLGLYIYGNRIWRCGHGINIIPGRLESSDDIDTAYPNPYHTSASAAPATVSALSQGQIYVYRNIIGRCLWNGIDIELKSSGFGGAGFDYSVFRDILIVNNTIDYNGGFGISVARAFTEDEKSLMTGALASTFTIDAVTRWFENIGVYNNILSRNGVRLARDDYRYDKGLSFHFMQLRLGDLIESTDTGQTDFDQFYIDHNLYQVSRQHQAAFDASATTLGTELVAGLRYWWWRPTNGPMEVKVNAEVDVATLQTLGFENWSSAAKVSNPSDAEFADPLPRDPDLHPSGTSPAIDNALASTSSLDSRFVLLDYDLGLFVPLVFDYDGVASLLSGSGPEIGALNA